MPALVVPSLTVHDVSHVRCITSLCACNRFENFLGREQPRSKRGCTESEINESGNVCETSGTNLSVITNLDSTQCHAVRPETRIFSLKLFDYDGRSLCYRVELNCILCVSSKFSSSARRPNETAFKLRVSQGKGQAHSNTHHRLQTAAHRGMLQQADTLAYSTVQ